MVTEDERNKERQGEEMRQEEMDCVRYIYIVERTGCARLVNTAIHNPFPLCCSDGDV